MTRAKFQPIKLYGDAHNHLRLLKARERELGIALQTMVEFIEQVSSLYHFSDSKGGIKQFAQDCRLLLANKEILK